MLQSMITISRLICINPQKKINLVGNHKHWPVSMKNKMQWFPFLTIMEHAANKMQEDKGLISSLLKKYT